MITVTDDFKTTQKNTTKEVKAYLTDGVDPITGDDDLKSLKITSEGNLCKSVMRQAEVVYLGDHDYLDNYVNLGVGVVRIGYQYQKTITIDKDKVVGPLTNFILWVDITDNDLKSSTYGGYVDNGTYLDIKFLDGTTKLSHEVESYDPETGKLKAWVKIPVIDSDEDKNIILRFGCSQVTASEENVADVWADYEFVSHLSDTVSDVGPNGFTINETGVATEGTGLLNKAQDFAGDGAYFETADDVKIRASNNITIQALIKLDDFNPGVSDSGGYVVKLGDYLLRGDDSTTPRVGFFVYDTAYRSVYITGLQTGVWYWVTGKVDGSVSKVIVNDITPSTRTGIGTVNGSAGALTLGRQDVSRFMDGLLDEVRIRKDTLSNDHIYTEYNNISDFSTFASVGEIEIVISTSENITEYIDYGEFKVVSQEINEGNGNVKLKLYDKMYEANQAYDLTPSYPITLIDLWDLICTRFSWVSGIEGLVNGTLPIADEPFSESKLTFRQILDQIAEASGSIIYFDTDDELVAKSLDVTGSSETLTSSDLFTLKLSPIYQELNSLVLSRSPQEDNIAEQDAESIALYGTHEVKFFNNLILDPDRETYITPIFEQLNGLTYYPFEARTVGLGYLQVGDRIKVTDPSDNEYEVMIFKIDLLVDGGIRETISGTEPSKTSTNYNYAGIIGQTIKNTEIIVDRQEGEIILINEDITNIESNVATLTQTTEDIQIGISTSGGENLLKNSVGLKGTIEEWQNLDENGDPIDIRNDATVIRSTDVSNNTTSNCAISIEDQFIQQSVSTIDEESYTFYCRFKKVGDCVLTINGTEYDVDTTGYVDNTWGEFSQEIVMGTNSTIIKLETATGDSCVLSDMVFKIGTANGWIQAPNEVYGVNFRFDKDGFSLESLSSSFRSVLDNEKLTIYNTSTSKTMAQFSVDSALMTDAIVQDSLTIQRYENSASAVRTLPTSTGGILVIND